ncbi:MAG: diverse intracellular signaling, partial [Bacteroidota bacterium]
MSALATTTNNTDTVIINTYQEQYSVKPYIFAANANTNWHFSTETIKWLNKTTLKEITASDTLLINQWYVGKLIIKSAINIDLQLGLHLSNANIQEFYLPVSGVTRSTGSNITRYKNDELFSHSDIVSVPISANSITEIYFRFFSYEPIFVSPALYQLNYIQRVGSDREVDEFSSRSFFLGSFLLLLIISLIVVIFNRRRAYLYYSVYVLCVGFINSSFDSFFEVLSISGRYSFFVGELLGGLAWISYFLFIQNFLQTKRYFPPWHKIMNFIIVAVVVFVLMIIVLLGWQNDKMLYLKYRNAYTLLIFLLSLPIFIRFVFSKRQIAIIVG